MGKHGVARGILKIWVKKSSKSAFGHGLAWHPTGNKLLTQPMVIQFTDTYVTFMVELGAPFTNMV